MEWVKKEKNYRVPVKSWCRDIEPTAMAQAADLAAHPSVVGHVALMPDCHPGFGMPIGGVVACEDVVIPNAVGVDIGCGMGAVKTDIPVSETDREKIRGVAIEVRDRVPKGEGRSHKKPRRWDELEEKMESLSERGWFSSHVRDLAGKNLGTLGGGNHFIEIQAGDDGFVWLMLHSGSRHLGNTIAKFYHRQAVELNRQLKIEIPCDDLAFLRADSALGQAYIDDMNFALRYARENRARMMKDFMDAFTSIFKGANFNAPVNIHHNYAALENHLGKDLWVHRKGATSARKGEVGIIPGSMGAPSYIVEGLGNPDAFMSCSHGAGRVMGRKEASRVLTPESCDKAMEGIVYDRWHKIRRGKDKGMFDLGEAPQAYKDIQVVMEAQNDLVKIRTRLRPLGVVKG